MSRQSNCTHAGVAIALLLTALVSASAQKQGAAKRQYPLECAGLRAGESTDADVRRLYGKGLFVADEDHGGGRYFIDPDHNVTLHTTLGPDRIVFTVEYSAGVHLPRKPTAEIRRRATSARLNARLLVGKRFQLGVSAREILLRYGKPFKNTLRNGSGSVQYEADDRSMPNVLFYQGDFTFRKNRLVSVSIYNGE